MKQAIKRYIDRIWKFTDDFNFDVIHKRESNPFEDVIPNLAETAINESYLIDNRKWTHKEYIKHLKRKVIIDPDFSYCITALILINLNRAFLG